jgi:molybdopterin synthase catalytic subunit
VTFSASKLLSGIDFGIAHQTWSAAKEQARDAMIKRAKIRGMISYSDLVTQVTALLLEPHDVRLFHLLGEIASEEEKAGRGMLTVVVVHKTGDMEPGKGFYELAQLLGHNTGAPLKFWVSELHKVHAIWSKKPN